MSIAKIKDAIPNNDANKTTMGDNTKKNQNKSTPLQNKITAVIIMYTIAVPISGSSSNKNIGTRLYPTIRRKSFGFL